MESQDRRPSWWQLYLLGLGMIGLLVLGAAAHFSEREHVAATIGTLVLGFGLTELWLRANSRALLYASRPTPVRQPRTESLDGPDAQHTAILVSRLEYREPEAPQSVEGAPIPSVRSG